MGCGGTIRNITEMVKKNTFIDSFEIQKSFIFQPTSAFM